MHATVAAVITTCTWSVLKRNAQSSWNYNISHNFHDSLLSIAVVSNSDTTNWSANCRALCAIKPITAEPSAPIRMSRVASATENITMSRSAPLSNAPGFYQLVFKFKYYKTNSFYMNFHSRCNLRGHKVIDCTVPCKFCRKTGHADIVCVERREGPCPICTRTGHNDVGCPQQSLLKNTFVSFSLLIKSFSQPFTLRYDFYDKFALQ